MAEHAFDAAMALTAQAEDLFLGRTSPAYWNMVGPFGGISAAQALQAVLRHPKRLGEPVSFTANFAAALGEGPFRIEARPVRTNRSTQHWLVLLSQTDQAGQDAVALTATVVTAVRRSTWSTADAVMPEVPTPGSIERGSLKRPVAWLQRYDIRPCAGGLPEQWDGTEADSLTQLWMRDDPPRPLDFCSLLALADVFPPRVWRRRARMTPVGTVSMTVYFHAGADELTATGSDYLLGQARAQSFFNGFFDQSAELWNQAGQLLATSHQIVYFKE